MTRTDQTSSRRRVAFATIVPTAALLVLVGLSAPAASHAASCSTGSQPCPPAVSPVESVSSSRIVTPTAAQLPTLSPCRPVWDSHLGQSKNPCLYLPAGNASRLTTK